MTEDQYRVEENRLLNQARAAKAEMDRLAELHRAILVDLDLFYLRHPVKGETDD